MDFLHCCREVWTRVVVVGEAFGLQVVASEGVVVVVATEAVVAMWNVMLFLGCHFCRLR